MKSALLAGLLALLCVSAQKPKTCYWDSDCSTAQEAQYCCIQGHCRSKNSCSVLRGFPVPNFSACAGNSDCQSGCCHNKVCTLNNTCEADSGSFPMKMFLVVLLIVTVALGVYYWKEKQLNKMRKQLARNMSLEGARKNKERLQQIQEKGGARKSSVTSDDRGSASGDLGKLGVGQTAGSEDGDENPRSKMNESRSSSSSRRSRKIHGYGVNGDEDQEESMTYTSRQPGEKKDGKNYTKKYLPQALKADGSEPLLETPRLDI